MKVFISYGDSVDLTAAFRLQVLAESKGMSAYVPSASTRMDTPFLPDPDVNKQLTRCDAVWGIVVAGLSPACIHELNESMGKSKRMLLMSDSAYVPQLQPNFGPHLFVIEPYTQDHTEREVLSLLKFLDRKQTFVKACWAMAGIGGLAYLLSAIIAFFHFFA